ncbi:hypothetical protein [Fervidibacillus halotolerans]|uniref:Uncharacterized protein n=1 Tax=Fervidibacillus halotolerans TaxID=2980027 RepID=A0A9E8M0E2_9BACI|nr:hypothetical protein [Fervidibacillus halotolerans]WAA13163.1 hypothetical protein OE105_03265 [Fervidibacillus halotolerans]
MKILQTLLVIVAALFLIKLMLKLLFGIISVIVNLIIVIGVIYFIWKIFS